MRFQVHRKWQGKYVEGPAEVKRFLAIGEKPDQVIARVPSDRSVRSGSLDIPAHPGLPCRGMKPDRPGSRGRRRLDAVPVCGACHENRRDLMTIKQAIRQLPLAQC
jgi:hypothetical protein